jgi:hypothetical protein
MQVVSLSSSGKTCLIPPVVTPAVTGSSWFEFAAAARTQVSPDAGLSWQGRTYEVCMVNGCAFRSSCSSWSEKPPADRSRGMPRLVLPGTCAAV